MKEVFCQGCGTTINELECLCSDDYMKMSSWVGESSGIHGLVQGMNYMIINDEGTFQFSGEKTISYEFDHNNDDVKL